MKLELAQKHFSEGWGIFDVGCVLRDTEGAEIEIVRFSGYAEIDDTDGTEQENVIVHFGDGSAMEFETLDREVIKDRKFEPVRPDWFVVEVREHRGEREPSEPSEAEQAAEAEAKQTQAEEAVQLRFIREVKEQVKGQVKAEVKVRPIEHYTDPELFATISGAPLSIAEEMLTAYEGNLARMAGASPKHMQKVKGISRKRAAKIIAAFELGKRLARFHAKKTSITSPSDVADLMMSKMRYLTKEIVCVLCLDTKGNVTTTGKAGDLVGDLRWGKMVAESTIFEGTLNASVFHPREIFRFAIEESANSVVLLHNHPSGDPKPSQEDIRATKQLIEAGNHIGIKVLDHIIIGDGTFVSLKEEGFI